MYLKNNKEAGLLYSDKISYHNNINNVTLTLVFQNQCQKSKNVRLKGFLQIPYQEKLDCNIVIKSIQKTEMLFEPSFFIFNVLFSNPLRYKQHKLNQNKQGDILELRCVQYLHPLSLKATREPSFLSLFGQSSPLPHFLSLQSNIALMFLHV